ncbi:protein-export chaperone SecB [Candidatus Pelagibacter sp.]|nr:protein-export chaperone SecB [Candidatus Pelagibacter sp.]
MTKNYKILTSYVRDISSRISGTENFIYLKDNIPKYSLGIDINSFPLKNNMAEVNVKLTFDNKNEKEKKAYFEMTHTTVIRVEETAVNKDEIKKIFLSDVPAEMYPEIEKKFFEIVKSIGYPEIRLEKKINFQEMFEKNQK